MSQLAQKKLAALGVFESEIRKTGFVLENRIAQLLRKEGWSVISNKYYVDDNEETVREIDLIAYQVNKVQHFKVFTTLIISCKKSETNAWALLTRNADHKAPNSDWWPLHAWSNDKALGYVLSEIEVPRQYHDDMTAKGVKEALALPLREVFAFQEMNRLTGVPKNDSPMFSAVTSLMKAQAYEMGALPRRRKDPVAYQFNLLSVVDADLIRLNFDGDSIKATPIESENYIARYIIGKRETFARVRFIHANALETSLKDYGRLHRANLAWFEEQLDRFFEGVLANERKRQVFLEEFRKEVRGRLHVRLVRARKGDWSDLPIDLDWRNEVETLLVQVPTDATAANFLNEDVEARRYVADALKKIYRFKGKFIIENGIPF